MGFEKWFGNKTGLVLNGGGGKGAYQIGAFKAIREAGLNDLITAVSGSSIGSLNMCLFNYDDGMVGEDIWSNLTSEQFVDPDFELIDGREGLVSRDGLLKILADYIDFDKIRNNPLDLYASVTEYLGVNEEIPRASYMKLNGKSNEEIKQILLASSCMPFVYEPVVINGITCRDGGLTDNLPIKPLYDLGIRQFIVILLNHEGKVPVERFPGSEFVIIRPSKNLGDTLTGTLNFSQKSSKEKMELGYIDCARTIRYYGEKNVDVNEIARIELRQFENKIRVDNAMNEANSDLGKINDLMKKYM